MDTKFKILKAFTISKCDFTVIDLAVFNAYLDNFIFKVKMTK